MRNFRCFSFWATSTLQKSHLVLNSVASGFADYKEIHLDTGWPLHLFFERTIYIDRDLEPMAAAIVRRTLDIIVEEEQEEEKR